MDQYFWNWGNFDYNRGYKDGMIGAEKVVRDKDEEIKWLKAKIKKLLNDNNLIE